MLKCRSFLKQIKQSMNLSSASATNMTQTDDIFPTYSPRHLAIQDMTESVKRWRVWLMMAYQDIRLRYKRSVLGPFWVTLSMAITVFSMGYLYGHLFHMDLAIYFPFLAAGMITWALISNAIIDLTDAFITSEALIKQIKLPYMLYIFRVATRNMVIFFHNILVFIPIYLIFHKSIPVNLHTFMVIPGLLVIYLNCLTYGLVLGLLGARYRDVTQVIRSFVQIIFFITPIMWAPTILSAEKQFLASWNPFYTFIELVRAPLFGQAYTTSTLILVSVITILGLLFSYALFVRYRSRIIYWL